MMIKPTTPWFWNCLGTALMFVSVGIAWSLIRSTQYEIGVSTHQIKVTRQLKRVKEANQEVVEAIEKSGLKSQDKTRTLEKLEQSQEIIDQTSDEINDTQQKLLD